MKTKMIGGFLMGLLLISMTAFAQDQGAGDGRQPPSADEIVSMMQSKLNLTQDQVSAVTPIIEKYSSKREELRQSMEDGTADRDSIRSQMKQLKTDQNQELGQVLSADQMGQLAKIQGQGRHNHHSNGGSGDSGADGDHNSEGGGNGT